MTTNLEGSQISEESTVVPYGTNFFCQHDLSGSTRGMNFKICMQIGCGGRLMPFKFFLISHIISKNARNSIV